MNDTRKNDNYVDGFANRRERYKQYDIIDSIFMENYENGKYHISAFWLDRIDSEIQHAFVIGFDKHPGKIVFNSISEFEKWING